MIKRGGASEILAPARIRSRHVGAYRFFPRDGPDGFALPAETVATTGATFLLKPFGFFWFLPRLAISEVSMGANNSIHFRSGLP